MSRTKEIRWGWWFACVAMTAMLVLGLGLLTEHFSIVSHAQSQGRVKVTANIRKEANKSSEILGSALENANVTINHQMKAADGTIWYQVFVDSNTLGYIRSDLVEITDGTTPPTQEANTTAATTPTTSPAAANETPAQVEELNPVSASVTGSQPVRVRSNASTGSQIVTTVQSGMALTVTGRANGTDNNVWYQVNFIADGSEVTGFIRSDYVSVSGELVPATSEEPPAEPEDPTAPATPEEPIETKDYETKLQGDTWFLIDYKAGQQYEIQKIFNVGTENKALYEEELKKVNSQKIAIIIMVILLVGMAGVIAFLIFKMKDMMDSAYFSQVEKETIRRRGNERAQGGNSRVMHTVGAEKKRPAGAASTQGGARAAGQQRPAGAASAQGGVRTTGQQRSAGAASAQTGARPAGQKRSEGTTQAGARPIEQKRTGRTAPMQAGARSTEQKHTGGMTSTQRRPAGTVPVQGSQTPNPGWKSKNFMQDDDEFEFEFLNWNGEEDL